MLASRLTTSQLAAMEDSMEISSEWNAEDDIDIDIDLTAGHDEGEEDYMIEDIGDDTHPAHDDMMEDDDGHSYNMDDAEGMEDHDIVDEQPADMSFEGDVDIHDTVFDDAEHVPEVEQEAGMGTVDANALDADDFNFDNFEDAEIYMPEGEVTTEGADGEPVSSLDEAGSHVQDEVIQGTDFHEITAVTGDELQAVEEVVDGEAPNGEIEHLEEEDQDHPGLGALDVAEDGAEIWDLDEDEEPNNEPAEEEANEVATVKTDLPTELTTDILAGEHNDSHSNTPLATGATSVGDLSHEDTPEVASRRSTSIEQARSPPASAGSPSKSLLDPEVDSNEHEVASDEAIIQPDEAKLDDLHELPRKQEVQIWYNGSEYSLFSIDESDDPDTYFLSDFSITGQTLDVFFNALRNVIGHELTPDQRLGFAIEELGLELDETSVPEDVTLGSILNLRDKLFKNDGTASIEYLRPIYMILEIKIDFSAQFRMLSTGAAEGSGLSEFAHYAQSESHESPVDEDGLAHDEAEQPLADTSEETHIEESSNTIDTEKLQSENAEIATSKTEDNPDLANTANLADTYHEDDLIDYSEDELEPQEAPKTDTPDVRILDEDEAKNEGLRQRSIFREPGDNNDPEQEQVQKQEREEEEEQLNGENQQNEEEQHANQDYDDEYESHETTDATCVEEGYEEDYAVDISNTENTQPPEQHDKTLSRVDTEEELIGDVFDDEINFGEDDEGANVPSTPKQDHLNLSGVATPSGSAGSERTLEASNEAIASTVDEIDYDDDDEVAENIDTLSSVPLQNDDQTSSTIPSKRARSDERFEEGLETENQDAKRSRS